MQVGQCNVGPEPDDIEPKWIADRVDAGPATEQVGVGSAATFEDVGARATINDVVSGACLDQIVASAGIDRVSPTARVDLVVARRLHPRKQFRVKITQQDRRRTQVERHPVIARDVETGD